jgi:DNA adenine methylase
MNAPVQAPTRPVLRWHGGKWMLADWIIKHFPAHLVYTEAFGGAGSVLLKKPRAHGEVWNDLDEDLYVLMDVLRDEARAAELIRQLHLTCYSRAEFERAFQIVDEPIERSRRTIVRAYMGYGSDSAALKPARRGFRISTGFRANSNRSGAVPARYWSNYPDALRLVIERLRDVTIESRPAVELMQQHDSEQTLHYVDPPYLPETRQLTFRANGHGFKPMYRHELDRGGHVELLQVLRELKGMVVLSGYRSALYDETLPDWLSVERPAFADGAEERTEVLWINTACWQRLSRERAMPKQQALFEVDA